MQQQTLRTFLSQGSAAGAIGIFLLTVCAILYIPNGYNFLLLVYLPIVLVIGLVIGTITGVLIWLLTVILKRPLGFLRRSIIGIAFTTAIAVVYSLDQGFIVSRHLFLLSLLTGCLIGLPTGIMTGSTLRPWRAILFGLPPRGLRRNSNVWFSFPSALLLRVGSLFGLLESLLILAIWASSALANWWTFPAREDLTGIVVAILYFAISAYASFTFPRKSLLLLVAVFLNTPLAIWSLNPHRRMNPDPESLAIVAWLFISLWIILVVGRMIAPNAKHGSKNGNSACAQSMAGDL